jgi:CyaY protein
MGTELTEQRFEVLADETLRNMVERLDDAEMDGFDADLESGVLTIRFDVGPKFVVNSHRAARQIWMAAGATAWHFDLADGQWVAHKSGDELWSTVSKRVSDALGHSLTIQP